jgi:hypothetical protein
MMIKDEVSHVFDLSLRAAATTTTNRRIAAFSIYLYHEYSLERRERAVIDGNKVVFERDTI